MIWSALFLVGLTVATLAAVAWGGPGLKRAGFAMMANWTACMIAVAWTGSLTPWVLFLLLDAATAVAVIRHPASRPQAIIGAVYLFQMAFHVAYAVVGNGLAAGLYLDLLALGGWLQIGTLFGGAIYGGGRTLFAAPRLRGGLRGADSADRRSLGASR